MSVGVTLRAQRRAAYVLVIVLGLAVVSFSVGTAYLEAHQTVLTEAVNLDASSRARCLAGSGVDIACHYLMYPPDGVADDAYWTGAKAMRVDASHDYVSLRVDQDASYANIFEINSFGFAFDIGGNSRAKCGVRATVMIPPQDEIRIPYAIQCGGTLNAAPNVTLVGDVHAESDITMEGACDGNVTSVGAISWASPSTPASAVEGAISIPTPRPDAASFVHYTVDGTTYSALVYGGATLDVGAAAAISAALDAAKDNPGRVVAVDTAALKIEEDVTLQGTLAVSGSVSFKGAGNHTIVSRAGYPAIMCKGDVGVETSDAIVAIYGPVICARLDLGSKKGVQFVVTGAVVTTADDGVYKEDGEDTTVTLTWDPARSSYHNLSPRLPYTLIRWSEY